MSKVSIQGQRLPRILVLALIVAAVPALVWGRPVGGRDALHVAKAWLSANPAPMARTHGSSWKALEVRPFISPSGELLAYIVDLEPKGFIVVPADDDIEPILTFSTEGSFSGEVGPNDPLAELLLQDIPNRLRNRDKDPTAHRSKISHRWSSLRAAGDQDTGFAASSEHVPPACPAKTASSIASPPDPLGLVISVVNPFVLDLWNQGDAVPGLPGYNYYTPNHYVTGCGATAMGMILHYFRWPQSASCSKTIYVDRVAQQAWFNDTFNYDLMTSELNADTPIVRIQEVAKLLRDCGIAFGSGYTATGTVSSFNYAPTVYKDVFQYVSADFKSGNDPDWATVLKNELSAGYPVELGIRDSVRGTGHAVVCDGWGTEDGFDRFHLNMGWGGYSNNWYAVPGFQAGGYTWDVVDLVHNIRSPVSLQVAAPEFSPDAGSVPSPGYVTVTCNTPGVTVRYTTNGIDPTTSSNTVASGGSVLVTNGMTLKAKAWKTGWLESNVTAAKYYVQNRVYVNKSAPGPAHDGGTWLTAFTDVQSAIQAASPGMEVWVAAGVYQECIALKSDIALCGGFVGTETTSDQRDWLKNAVVLDGNHQGPVVTVADSATRATRVDGFEVRNGEAANGGGIYCRYGSSPTVTNCTISGNHANYGGGIFCDHGSPLITNNTIRGNSATTNGGGIACSASDGWIVNNTLASNTAAAGGGVWADASTTRLANNIVAFNSSGLHKAGAAAPVLERNCVFGNGADYTNLTPGTDISADPLFVDGASGDCHLRHGSPCIDAGTNSSTPIFDKDGAARPQDGDGNRTATCDIGAYEYPLDLGRALRTYQDGDPIAVGAASVTALFSSQSQFFVERTDRSSGIRVDASCTGWAEGKVVNVYGTIRTAWPHGERYISPTLVEPVRTGSVLRPLGLQNRSLVGCTIGWQPGLQENASPNNVGLLVRTWGRFTYDTTSSFLVDDGSGAQVRVLVPSGVTISPTWQYVLVTGISARWCPTDGATPTRALRVRKRADIVTQ